MATQGRRLLGHLIGQDPVLDYLGAHQLFGVLPRVVLVGLAAEIIEREYRKGHHIYLAGDPPSYVYILRSGLVALTQEHERGNVQAVLTCFPGEAFGLPAVVFGERRTLTAIALIDTLAWLVERETFLYLYDNLPDLSRQVTREVHNENLRSRQALLRLARTSVACRVAAFLIEHATRAPASDGQQLVFDLSLSHQDIALLVQTTRETVSRVLAGLCRRGVIAIDKRRVTILRPDALRDLAYR